ncbi:MAG: hypothetical protein Q8N53_20125, partial [Longimicrobiales bacterium]|nr:hypothetical protein [Longimicrobiales bacterium]
MTEQTSHQHEHRFFRGLSDGDSVTRSDGTAFQDKEQLKGKELGVVYKQPDGAVVGADWTIHLDGGHVTYLPTDYDTADRYQGDRRDWNVYKVFIFETQTRRQTPQGSVASRKRYDYEYDYGNQTDVWEYLSASDPDPNWYRHTARSFFPVNDTDPGGRYIVNKLARETVEKSVGGGGGEWVRKTDYCYDGSYLWSVPIGSTGPEAHGGDGSYHGRLTAVRRARENATESVDVTYTYDGYGNRLTTTEHGTYGVWTGALATGDPRTTSKVYDPAYHTFVVEERTPLDPSLPATVTEYDYRLGKPTRVTDPNGAATVHTYDDFGRLKATWLPGDNPDVPGAATITYRYLLPRVDSAGNTFGAPLRVQVGRRKDAGGGSWGRRGYQWQCYDGLGRLVQTQADFERSSQPIRAQDVNEVRSALIARGVTPSVSAVTASVDRIQAAHYVGLGNAVQTLWTSGGLGTRPDWSSAVTPNGPSVNPSQPATLIFGSDLADLRGWLNHYEATQNLTPSAWTYDAGQVVVVNRVYDGRGLLQKESVPHLLTVKVPGQFQSGDWGSTGSTPGTSHAYDALRRSTQRTLPDGSHADWSYSGWTTTATDENGHKKEYVSDGPGRLVAVREYSDATNYVTTQYGYDVADQLTSVTDALNNQTSIVYDKLGRKTELHDPDMGVWHYSYEPAGNLQCQTDARSQQLWLEYDKLKRLTRKRRDSQGGTVLAEYTYDETTGGFAQYSGRGR